MIIKICDDMGKELHVLHENGLSVWERKPDHICEGVVHVDEDGMASVIKEHCNQINPFLKCERGRKVKVMFFLM